MGVVFNQYLGEASLGMKSWLLAFPTVPPQMHLLSNHQQGTITTSSADRSLLMFFYNRRQLYNVGCKTISI